MTREDEIESLTYSVKKLDIQKRRSPSKTEYSAQPKSWTRQCLKTGLILDDFMTKHNCLWTKADECPERYECTRDRFKQYGLIDKCLKLEAQIATKEQVLLAHDEDYYELVRSTKDETDVEKLKRISEKYDGIYFNQYTYDAAMMALGSAIKLSDAILDNDRIKNGFALVRPPGHHAQRSEPNGYCLFNNAAIVAKHCIHNRNLKRVLIVDWDVHHGQGTQYFFYDDPRVMYVSIHRYEKGKYWPELIESNFNFTGEGAGKGYNINLPLNETGCNDADFLLMWFNVILPVAYEYNPELVIISAGFDAAIGCPEGKMRVKPITYHILCHSLMALAEGKILALFEGGYNLLSLAESAAMTLRALLGYSCPRIDTNIVELDPHESIIQTILDVIWAIRPQWAMLQLQGSFNRFDPDSTKSCGGGMDTRLKYIPVATYEGRAYTANKLEKYELDGVACPKNEEEQSALHKEIQSIISRTDLSVPTNLFAKRTLLIADDGMILHRCEDPHPEKPERYIEIKRRLEEAGLFDSCEIGHSREATEDEIALVHDKKYIEKMKSTASLSSKELGEYASSLDSIYLNQSTYHCALLAAGCVIEAVDRVIARTCLNAFALIRPPGHHAGFDYAAGFCIFNNVVIAAKHALTAFPDTCKRVLIVDYDFHHGDGVQHLVQDDDRICYISIHGFNDAEEYPFKQLSNYNTGSGNIINIPWNDVGMGDSEYMLAFFSVVLPCAYEFNPDLVLVSSGFDAAVHDPLGRYKVSPEAFGHFIHHLMPLASGKLVACLEGGYNLESISESSANVVSVLLGNPPKSLQLKPPSEAAVITIKNVISYQKSNHKLLCLDYDLPSDELD